MVMASSNLDFTKWDSDIEAKLSGWKELHENNNVVEFTHFYKQISDHNLVYFEVHSTLCLTIEYPYYYKDSQCKQCQSLPAHVKIQSFIH